MRAGNRSRKDGITVYVRPGVADTSRLGVAVRARNAVTRNRIKRRIRAAFREARTEESYDVVVRAEGATATMNFQELSGMLASALRREDARCV